MGKTKGKRRASPKQKQKQSKEKKPQRGFKEALVLDNEESEYEK